ncbi:hypothetical protein P154DRAFT_519625 [Amniculicola lignicola CBS 123094]|uniref:Uncharacterized protein n=1 Tax=Amniculicola lignicola CBS 123094 TaxID=1392246 RepID=A0A6A5WSK8_9PLEO|nr:hypothetical protein P154DRAFT_519625 [Amniculicola lignicola CBS 123094]
MVLPVDPVALTTLSVTLASKAWTTFKTALHFSDDADDLILRLNIEQARFQLWSRNVGYEKEGDSFDECLLPVIELINDVLTKLTGLFEDAEQLRKNYGLIDNTVEVSDSKKLQKFILRLNKALKGSGLKTTPAPEEDENALPPLVHRTSTFKKMRWGVQDKLRFQELVEAAENHVLKLNQLLNDSNRQARLAEDRTRLNVVIVGSIEDEATLQLVKSATHVGIQDAPMRNLCGRLALSDRLPTPEAPMTTTQLSLPFSEFPSLEKHRETLAAHILVQRKSASESLVLLEKKTYPPTVSHWEFGMYSERIQRIALLLCKPQRDLRTLRCLGYVHDSPGHCWWLVFEYPSPIPATQSPISLMDLFGSKSPNKPPLEDRLNLARKLASSVSSLFNSSWVHKSLRSENIIFVSENAMPKTGSPPDTSSPLLTGFEYSRQRTEHSLGKPDNKDIPRSIYRHPFYQDQNSGTYLIQYDIYSFGLVLVDIARWMPLASFLDKAESPTNDSKQPQTLSKTESQKLKKPASTRPRLPAEVDNFTEADAKELQKRVLSFVDRELAFRVGTPYRDAVRWCLTHHDEKVESDVRQAVETGVVAAPEEDWRSALEFYNNVVVPLEHLALGNGVSRLSGDS